MEKIRYQIRKINAYRFVEIAVIGNGENDRCEKSEVIWNLKKEKWNGWNLIF
jgi:hypothetical protein